MRGDLLIVGYKLMSSLSRRVGQAKRAMLSLRMVWQRRSQSSPEVVGEATRRERKDRCESSDDVSQERGCAP